MHFWVVHVPNTDGKAGYGLGIMRVETECGPL